jgi:hypothetical protein
MSSFLHNLVSLALAIAAILFADCMVNRASASCGDYVRQDGKPVFRSQTNAMHMISGALPRRSTPCPCKNGSCSKSPEPAPFRPASRVVNDVQRHALLVDDCDIDAMWCVTNATSWRIAQPPETVPFGILRPPRSA